MWHSLKRSDIEEARRQIAVRRAETLRRHAEEIGKLEADRSELELLRRLAEAFAEKYGRPKPPPFAQPAPAKVVISHAVHRPAPEPRRPERRDYGGTNFGTFARAVAKTGV